MEPKKYADGGGLWLLKRTDGGGQWSFRYSLHGRAREMGLGSAAVLTLADAWRGGEEWRNDYNRNRPHSALGNLTPLEFAEKITVDRIAA